MSPREFRRHCNRTWKVQPDRRDNLLHAAMGIGGEAGEVVEFIKKVTFNVGWPPSTPPEEGIIAELGDLLYYIDRLALYYGTTLEEIMDYNVAKLERRYPS